MGKTPKRVGRPHNAAFEKNLHFLNLYHFDRIYYQFSNGTDLLLSMIEHHIWGGGAVCMVSSRAYFPHILTEEAFPLSDRMRAGGIGHATLSLVRDSSMARDFWFRFKDGKGL